MSIRTLDSALPHRSPKSILHAVIGAYNHESCPTLSHIVYCTYGFGDSFGIGLMGVTQVDTSESNNIHHGHQVMGENYVSESVGLYTLHEMVGRDVFSRTRATDGNADNTIAAEQQLHALDRGVGQCNLGFAYRVPDSTDSFPRHINRDSRNFNYRWCG